MRRFGLSASINVELEIPVKEEIYAQMLRLLRDGIQGVPVWRKHREQIRCFATSGTGMGLVFSLSPPPRRDGSFHRQEDDRGGG